MSQAVTSYDSTLAFDPNATYVIAGGLGGLGRSIARWLHSKGAMNLILLSRSGLGRNSEAQELVDELAANGVRVECPAIDIVDRGALQSYFEDCQQRLPLIKGCFQSAMVLRDATLANLTVENWHQAVAPKVKGTWNLHESLPTMDFFILLSSVVGIGGNRGQANYAAGNTFEDAFARWRTESFGCKTVSLDLGFVADAGMMLENDALVNAFLRRNVTRSNSLAEIFSLFERICDNRIPISNAEQSQIITGLKLPAQTAREGKEIPIEFGMPIFRILSQISSISGPASLTGSGSHQSIRSLFTAAASADEAADLASSALQTKLTQLTGLKFEDMDVNRPLSEYGMDSLIAVEIQGWIKREMDADISVFEVLGEATIKSLGNIITRKNTLRKDKKRKRV